MDNQTPIDMSIKVLSTTNYSRFKFMEGNRPVEARVNKLIAAISRKNELHLYPIVCQKNGDGRLYVADGQHRLKAAEAMKLPVFYIESKDITLADVVLANSVQKAWTLKDHVYSNAALGKPHYVTLKAFYENYKFPLSTCAAMLSNCHDGGNSAAIRAGRFLIKNGGVKAAQDGGDFILAIKPMFSGALDRSFAIALLRLMRVPGFSGERLMQKLQYQSTKLVKCANWQQYVELIDGIYNHKVQPKDMISLPLEVKKLTK